MSDPLFEFDHVTVRGERRDRLRDVTVVIPAEGVTAVVGSSGAGKSTLLRCCNRLEVPDDGVLRYRGEDVATLDPRILRRRVGMVFQRPLLFAGSVRDNLLAADPDASEARMLEVLASAGLEGGYLERTADELSGGEGQRACIARALLLEPEVLLADEPTSALDHRTAEELERTARSLVGDGRALLWVTHDLGQARRLADHVIVLDDGHVVASGSVDEVLDEGSPA